MKNPILIFKVDPEWTKDARKMKIQGLMLVNLIVDEKGKPTNVHVLRSITGTVPEELRAAALPLDQKAVDAVSRYRFKPGSCNGKIVPVEMNVEVNFDFQH
jgi:protein TonB